MSDRKTTREATRERHLNQTCKVYQVKINKSSLPKSALNHLNSLFLEGKWLYNSILASKDILKYDTKIKEVPVLVKDVFEDRKLSKISSQMKQGIKDRTFQNILSLAAKKKKQQNSKKKQRIGKLKFISYLNCIPLKQHNKTYKVIRASSRIKIQGIKKSVRVYGLNQLPKDCEIANGNLVKKADDYFVYITTYQKKVKKDIPDESIGIDFGCETQLTLSNRIKIKYEIPISKRLRRLDRKIMKKNRKRSNNKYKDQTKRQREYIKLTNIKSDIRNKIVSMLTNNYRTVIFQDESIHAWHAGNHGKKIQNTSIGGIIRDLKNKSHTPVMVDKFFPSTQLCPKCSKKNKFPVWVRTYSCKCGFKDDRDVKAAKCIETEGLDKHVPVERREFKLEETEASATNIFDSLESKYVRVSFCRKTSQEERFKKPQVL